MPSPGRPPAGAFPHLRALDGLRGVAVGLVVAYHLSPDLVPGGFLGVDVFFVLSGFLITSLLLAEVRDLGGVDLGRFYTRRVRRLAPALLLVVAAVAAYAATWASAAELDRLRDHSLWTLGYLANWHFIADGTTYTDLIAGESPLRHTWSLAIEEQFYLLFPLAVLVLGRATSWGYQRLRRALGAVALVGVLASAVWTAVLWGDGSTPSRGYFGTDTRAQQLLVGVLLGVVLVGRPARTGRLVAVGGWVGAGVLALAVGYFAEDSWALQHGGFLVVALATAGIIAAVERVPALRRALGWSPLVALGVISYGVYLWHWPVIVLVDADRTGLDGVPLDLARLGLTLVASVLSYRLVERPIRQGALGRHLGRRAVWALPVGAGAVAVAVVLASSTPSFDVSPSLPPVAAQEPSPAAASSEPVGVVMFGDSVAHTLAGGTVAQFPAFQPWAPGLSPFDPARVGLWSVAKPACSYLPGLLSIEGRDAVDLGRYCGDWRQDLDEALTAHPSTLVLVALSNDATDRRIDGNTVRLGSAAHAALVSGLLDEVRAVARPHGADLALLVLPRQVGRLAAEIDRSGLREEAMRDAQVAYAARHEGVRVLDLAGRLCPDGDCGRPPDGFDPSWRYDGLHYTAEGARWVARWITDELSAPTGFPEPGDRSLP